VKTKSIAISDKTRKPSRVATARKNSKKSCWSKTHRWLFTKHEGSEVDWKSACDQGGGW